MKMKELVNLISSLHHKHNLSKMEMYNVCMDTLGSFDANKSTIIELDAFVNAAFTACPAPIQEAFAQQEEQNNMLIEAQKKRVLSNNNVITGFFK